MPTARQALARARLRERLEDAERRARHLVLYDIMNDELWEAWAELDEAERAFTDGEIATFAAEREAAEAVLA